MKNKQDRPEKRAKKQKPAKQRGPKQGVQPPFALYTQSLPMDQQEALAAFFADMDTHLQLARNDNRAIRADFENALLHYAACGLPLADALQRLAIANLGGFYARPPLRWYPLDDAAKIYPLSLKHGQMAVFRLSVYLKADIVPALLQMALTFTIKRFPSFATTVKKGFFWHYLDASKHRYAAQPETDIPCRPLKVSRSGSQSFRVVYFQRRISVEYFHILTDGTGGMAFLQTLTAEYLRLLGTPPLPRGGILAANDAPTAAETANEFVRAPKGEGLSDFVDKAALQMSGRLSRIKPCQVLHFKMDAAALKQAAAAKGATITAYVLSLLFAAAAGATDEPAGDLNIQVPVNMRKFYPSQTVRNFAMYCGIRLPIGEITGAEAILPEISRQLGEKASRQRMDGMMASTRRMVRLMRYVPLFIKTSVARFGYGFVGDMTFTSTLSNLGVVQMPPQMAQQIDCMDFMLGTSMASRANCGLVTFGDAAVLSITKMTVDPSFEEALYGLLAKDGVTPVVQGSEVYEG